MVDGRGPHVSRSSEINGYEYQVSLKTFKEVSCIDKYETSDTGCGMTDDKIPAIDHPLALFRKFILLLQIFRV